MRELHSYRPGYFAAAGTAAAGAAPPAGFVPAWIEDAHRVVRNLVAIGEVLELPATWDARDAVEAAEHAFRYQPAEAAAVARLGDEVAAALATTLDQDGRATGPLAPRVVDEAARATVDALGRLDAERVFRLDDDGRVGLIRDRMGLADFLDELPAVTALLHRAAAAGAIVEFADGPPEPPDPFGLHLA